MCLSEWKVTQHSSSIASTGELFVSQVGVTGVVYLVGAGPGSPDLITLRGLRILRTADVILHDALIASELLTECRAEAVILGVGKRGYCIGSTKQETINEEMIRFAGRGLSVCRLKCGDPCVFGRGGEEAEALANAGISFQIVPGVTSAIGACASAGIPVTHRDVGQSVTLVTGHHDPDSPDCTLDWHALARMPGIVFYMAVRHISRIAMRLAEYGMRPMTPAAVIEAATLPQQRVMTGTLDEIATIAESAAIRGPAIFVVGAMVNYRARFVGLDACREGVLT